MVGLVQSNGSAGGHDTENFMKEKKKGK